MSTTLPARRAFGALYTGLALTLVATVIPHVDRATGNNLLARHLRAGYPSYTQAHIDNGVMTYLIYLSVVGALGVIGWLSVIWAVRAGRRWARLGATLLFTVGFAIALTDLTIRDTSGDTGLPPLFGWAGMLPSLAGVVAVAVLWRSRPSALEAARA